MPVVNPAKCEGKEPRMALCSAHVFTLDVLPREQRTGLGLMGALEGMAYGWKQAFVTYGDARQGCGLCVTACPEQAISLKRNSSALL